MISTFLMNEKIFLKRDTKYVESTKIFFVKLDLAWVAFQNGLSYCCLIISKTFKISSIERNAKWLLGTKFHPVAFHFWREPSFRFPDRSLVRDVTQSTHIVKRTIHQVSLLFESRVSKKQLLVFCRQTIFVLCELISIFASTPGWLYPKFH